MAPARRYFNKLAIGNVLRRPVSAFSGVVQIQWRSQNKGWGTNTGQSRRRRNVTGCRADVMRIVCMRLA